MNADNPLREYGRFGDLYSPRISVVIPAYNEEGYVSRSIESVLDQGYPNAEIIVVSNGSTDRTAEVVKKYADRGVRLHDIKESGIGLARNSGAQMATGDVVVFLDADTQMQAAFLERVKDSVNRGYVGGITSIEVDSSRMSDVLYYGLSNFFGKIITPVRNISQYLPERIRKHVPRTGRGECMYARKDVLRSMIQQNGHAFREDLKVGEDIDFVDKMHNYGWVDVINDKPVITSDRRLRKEGLKMWLKRPARYLFPEKEREYQAYRPDMEVGD